MDKFQVVHFHDTATIRGPYFATVLKTCHQTGKITTVGSVSCIETPERCNAVAMNMAEQWDASITYPLL